MIVKLPWVLAFAVGVVVGVELGCQYYDFEPVRPLGLSQKTQSKDVVARGLKPNLLLLVDKSGSMDIPVNTSASACPANCGQDKTKPTCPATCPTRWSELQAAMKEFLTKSGTIARMGLVTFPINSACGAAGLANVRIPLISSDDPTQLQNQANAINSELQRIIMSQPDAGTPYVTGGGTPTGESIKQIGAYPPLQGEDREDFILLLTDGLPNCNANNAADYAVNPTACKCTFASGVCSPPSNKIGCLDRDETVRQIAALLANNKIKTAVVGLGADTTVGDGPETLQAMAIAGGFPRSCPKGTDAECGTGNNCDVSTHTCAKKFFQASNAVELAAALAKISDVIDAQACDYVLEEEPSDPALLSVSVDGVVQPSGADTWQYAPGKVKFVGSLCTRIESATSAAPVKVEVKIIQTL